MPGKKQTLCIIGGDTRQTYAAHTFARLGYETTLCAAPVVPGICCFTKKLPHLAAALAAADVLLLPVPLSRDGETVFQTTGTKLPLKTLLDLGAKRHIFLAGAVRPEITRAFAEKKLTLRDFAADTDYLRKNAVFTAEGALAESILRAKSSFTDARALVLGYGRCGAALAARLRLLGAETVVFARRAAVRDEIRAAGCAPVSPEELEQALPKATHIFNTIPAMMLDGKQLRLCARDVYILDIASAPGGVNLDAAMQYRLQARLVGGIPGLYMPKSAGRLVAETVHGILNTTEEGDPHET
jgi:dipicolinate synthase subunit A